MPPDKDWPHAPIHRLGDSGVYIVTGATLHNLARLNYVHQNAVRHGLVRVANQYPWCSAAWFERTASPATVKTIYSFKIDTLRIDDDY